MSDQQAFIKLKDFFENRPICADAAEPLRSKVEIGIVINNNLKCAFFKSDGSPKFEQREAVNPDVIFYLSPEAIENLLATEATDIADLGISIAKAYLSGSIKIKVEGSMIAMLTNGYLGILKKGGTKFLTYLGSHGVSGISKMKDVFQKLRK